MTTLEELGPENYRATVSVCPHCLALYDGAYALDKCEADGYELETVRVRITDD